MYVILTYELSAFHLCYLPNYVNSNVARSIESFSRSLFDIPSICVPS